MQLGRFGMTRIDKLQFWANKKVLVTGHTGFKGSWLTLMLQSLGAQLKCYALEPTQENKLFELLHPHIEHNSVFEDIRNKDALNNCISNFQPEIIFHLAAQALVKESYHDPVATFSTNVMGTVNLLECARNSSSVRAIINVTSDKCYQNNETGKPFLEDDPMGGHDPYSASKGCAELVSASYYNSFFLNGSYGLATARAGNVLGGGDWSKDRIVPDVLAAISKGIPVEVRNPKAVRPWQHVLEPLYGYLLLAQELHHQPSKFSGGWNFGPDDRSITTVECVVEKILSYYEGSSWVMSEQKDNEREAIMLALNSDKAISNLLWDRTWTIDQTIHSIVEWHNAFQRGDDMFSLCKNQIKNFLNSKV